MEITGKNEKESEKLSPNFLLRISALSGGPRGAFGISVCL